MINNGKQKQWEENFHTLCPSPTHLPAPGPIYSTSCLCGWTAHALTYGQPFPMFTRSLSLCCPWLSPFSCIINYPLSTGQFRSAYIDTYVISPILQIKQITLLIPNSPSTIIPFLSSHPQQSSSRFTCANYPKLLFYSLWNPLQSGFHSTAPQNSSHQDLQL